MRASRDPGALLRRRSLRAALISVAALIVALSLGLAVSAAAPERLSNRAAAATSWPNGSDPCQIRRGTLSDDGIRGLMSLMSSSTAPRTRPATASTPS